MSPCMQCPERFYRQHEPTIPYLLASAPFFELPSTIRELFFDQPFEHLTDARVILISELYHCACHISCYTRFPDQTIAAKIALRIFRRRPRTILCIHGLKEKFTTLLDLRMIAR